MVGMVKNMESTLASGACFSNDRRYRYWLYREWDETKPTVAFIGLNPSRADEKRNDKTISTEIGFAKQWGFGAILALNVAAYCQTDPNKMLLAKDPIGSANTLRHLKQYMKRFNVQEVVVAWGKTGGRFSVECQAILAAFPHAVCLGRNLDGTPKHPSRLAYKSKRELYCS